MAYNNQENQITTSLIQLFDDNRVQIRLAAHDSGLSIAFWIPQFDEISGRTSYPQTQRFQILLTTERVTTLDKMIQDVLLPAYEEGTDKSVAVFTNKGRTNIFELKCVKGELYADMHLDVDATTIIPKTSYEFHFVKIPVLDGYNKATGEMQVVPVDGNFYIVAKVLSDFTSMAGTKLSGHGIRFANSYTTDAYFRYLKAFAVKLGVVVEGRTYNNNNPGYSSNRAYSNQQPISGPIDNGPAPNTEEVTDLTNLL